MASHHNGQYRRSCVNSARHLLNQIELETLPSEVLDLQKLIAVKHPNLADIADCLSKNPDVLGRLLSLVNQVVNRPQDDLILDAKTALHLMGLDELQRLFISAYMVKNLSVANTDPDFITQALRAALATTELSYWVYGLSRTEAYLHGFMQDIGAIYMMRYDAGYNERFFRQQLAFPMSKHRDEHLRYATDHCFVGALMIEHWNLGQDLCRTVLFHHEQNPGHLARFDEGLSKRIALLQIANYLVFETFAGKNVTKELDDQFTVAMDYLELPDNALNAAISALEKWGTELDGNTQKAQS